MTYAFNTILNVSQNFKALGQVIYLHITNQKTQAQRQTTDMGIF